MPISDCEVRDPRMRRTRQALQGALRTLLQSKNFEEVSVQDITEVAGVNRATFYDHYADKFALFDALIAGGFHQMLHERKVTFDGTCPSAARAIIEAACDYLVQMHSGHEQCRGRSSFEPLFDAAITTAIQKTLTRSWATLPGIGNGIAASAASWAIYGAVKQWYGSADRPPVAEIVPRVQAFVQPMLVQAFDLDRMLALASAGDLA